MNTVIAWFVRNGVATNLLMISLLVAGLAGLATMGQKIFPEFSLDRVEIRVPYPGAMPEEVETAVILPIEEALGAVEGIRDMIAIAGEGVAVINVELASGQDVRVRLDEIRAEVERITTFPDEAERPEVRELSNRQRVIELVLYGDVDEAGMRELAYRVKDDLAALPGISFTQVRGVRDYEVAIEFHPDRLRELGLSLPQVSAVVRASSLELPAGRMVTPGGEVVARTLGRNFTRSDFEDLVLHATADGGLVRLRDIATVHDAFRDVDLITRFNGRPAAIVEIFRIGDEQVLEVVDQVAAYLDDTLIAELPAGLEVRVWRNDGAELRDRLNLLLRNGLLGLLLVLLALTLFLDIRLAALIAAGIVISFAFSLAVMSMLGMTINMMSLFGFILAVGIVVDAGIVTGENIFSASERGERGEPAAIAGASRIAVPVIFAVTTTMVAFAPLLVVPGPIGRFLLDVPVTVIIVLAMSLLTALLILPRQLSRVDWQNTPSRGPFGRVEWVRSRMAAGLDRFTAGHVRTAVAYALDRPAFVIASGIAVTILALALVANDHVRRGFFPVIEGRYVLAELELHEGAAAGLTLAVAERLIDAAEEVGEALQAQFGLSESPVTATALSVGRSLAPPTPLGEITGIIRGHRASVVVELTEPEGRPFASELFATRWREAGIPVADEARRLRFSSRFVDLGPPIQIELAARDRQVLDAATDRLSESLAAIAGVHGVRDDREAGKQELRLHLTDHGRILGFTDTELARQMRAALFGDEALRVQRGRDELRVLVRLEAPGRNSLGVLEAYRLRAPNGGFVPLADVARTEWAVAPSTIRRRNGQQVTTVSADIDAVQVSGQQVNDRLATTVLPELVRDLPGLTWGHAGEQREQADAASSLALAFPLALFFIYVLLAVPFRSYLQPLVIMAVIPLGLAGALFGHLLLGLDLTLLSIFGIIGLSGVIINGSLVMIDFINEEHAVGRPWRDAVMAGALGRFRPILLTATTTFLGIAPLIFERSLQAQFLIPLAVSVGFGVLLGTAILMLIVPALCIVVGPGSRSR